MLRILKIIPDFPPRFTSGLVVYSRTLVHALVNAGHEMAVFSRFENPFVPDYEMSIELDPLEPRIRLYTVNMVKDCDRYRHEKVDTQLSRSLDKFKPDIVHIGHLNHLSTSIVKVIADKGIPILFTLHDYWLMCPQGQFIQTGLGEDGLLPLCEGQEDKKCAVKCYSRYFSGLSKHLDEDISYWTAWVNKRMTHIKDMISLVDLFIAPSKHLYNRFTKEFGLPTEKIVYLDYGFDLSRLSRRKRRKEAGFVFGYVGAHIPTKGLHHLIDAFGLLEGKVKLRIYGRTQAPNTVSLQSFTTKLSEGKAEQIEWLPEYQYEEIIPEVFNKVDAIVVPSIWDESFSMIIKEAQQARIPIIAANHGCMKEYVAHEINGLLFQNRNIEDLARQMQHFVDNPSWAEKLGKRGYLYSDSGDVLSIDEHYKWIIKHYEKALEGKN
ncbi:MAG: glycosyltransferase [Candidatus Hodarchaeota archaeon]